MLAKITIYSSKIETNRFIRRCDLERVVRERGDQYDCPAEVDPR
jgi:hypothetical protein